MKTVKLSDYIFEVNDRTTENDQYPVLTSSQDGIVTQAEYFNKKVASKDTTGYKIVRFGQFTYRAMSDTGRFYINRQECCEAGIVSPAYPVFTVKDNEDLAPEFLQMFFKTDYFQSLIANQSTGSTRVSLKLDRIKAITITVPTYDEQLEMVEKLHKLTKVIDARKEQAQCMDELVKSRFIELFGDPLHPQYSKPLGNVALLERGRFSPRPRNDPRYYGGTHPFIQTGDIANCNHRLSRYKQTLNDMGTTVSKKFGVGTIVIAIVGATIGATAILEIEAYAPDSVIGITVDETQYNNVFMETLLQFWQPELLRIAPESARANINLSILQGVPIVDVSLELQEQFAAFVEQTDKSKLYGDLEVAA